MEKEGKGEMLVTGVSEGRRWQTDCEREEVMIWMATAHQALGIQGLCNCAPSVTSFSPHRP